MQMKKKECKQFVRRKMGQQAEERKHKAKNQMEEKKVPTLIPQEEELDR